VLNYLWDLLGEGAGFTRTGPAKITIINFRDDAGVPFTVSLFTRCRARGSTTR
jgi:hypothetical protein